MIFRQLDSNHDWTFGKGLACYAQNEDAINLNIQTTVLSWVGDCFFDLTIGINWLQLLEIGQQSNLEQSLQALILSCYGVVGITQASAVFNQDTRKLDVQYNITTVYTQNYTSQVSIVSNTVGV